MMLHFNKLVWLFLLLPLLCCNTNSQEANFQTDQQVLVSNDNPVQIQKLDQVSFKKQLISNGKLKALRKSNLEFKTSETLVELHVQNGLRVSKGQLIARLNQQEQKLKLEQAKLAFEKAKLELQDYELGHTRILEGMTDSTRQHIANTQSGITEANLQVEHANNDLAATLLKAPFSGKIANLNYKLYEQVNAGEPFCTIIDDSQFEVEFFVLETELNEISLNKPIQMQPLSDTTLYPGRISEINPLVNENGLVLVRAHINNPGNLIEGMNARIIVETEIADQLVVPRAAVVQRQNQEVLFKYQDGHAFWTYVLTLYENSDSFAVIAHPDKSGSLAPGDTVIISGNLNLAHESAVTIDSN